MARYSDEIIDEIRNNNDIVDIISQYVILKRSGRNFFGLCPFHKEKTPSFSVSPDKQVFHCFGCGAGGDVIHFTSKIENIDFKDSIELLAEKAGINLPTTDSDTDGRKQLLKEKVYEINQKAAIFYHENLYKPTSKVAQEYIKKRELNNKTLKTFLIGYADGGAELYKYLKSEGYSDEQILESSLVNKTSKGFIDRFSNRLMFPIQDVRNRVIAFGGRVLDKSLPKYINSPENMVYSKARNLYGLNAVKKSDSQNIIIVEGYMDVISLYQRGIQNAVASCGTALTEAQGRLLRKYAEKIIISYDSDSAGQLATLRGLELLTNLGCDIRILQMDGAKDPDEFIIKFGNGKFQKLVQDAISLIEFKVKILKKDLDLENTNDKIKFLNEIAKLLGAVENKIEQEVYIDKISKEYKISKEAIYAETNKLSFTKNSGAKILEKKRSNIVIQKKEEESEQLIKREKLVILLLISNKKEIYEKIKNEIKPEDFFISANKKILIKIYEEYEKQDLNINNLLNLFNDDEEVISILTEILAENYEIKDDKKALENVLNAYKKEKLINNKNKIISKLNNAKQEEIKDLEQKLQDIIIELAQIK